MNTNKKTTLVIISLFVVILLSGILSLIYLNGSSHKLEKSIDAASISVTNKQWDSAAKNLKEFEDKWESAKFSWSILLDHFEIDNIDNSFIKSKKYVESEDFPSALAELEALKQYIKHIPQKESFSIKNIF